MAWFSGSSFGSFLLAKIFGNKDLQNSGTAILMWLGEHINDNLHNPDKLMTLAKNLVHNPKSVLGAMVKGTEAEKFVDPSVIEAAKSIVASNPVPRD